MTYTIIGVDPGMNTGIAMYTTKHVDPLFYSTICAGMNQTMISLEYLCENNWIDNIIVACEKYTITGRTAKLTQQHDALEITGAVKYLCLRKKMMFHPVQPSVSKKIGNTDRLRTLGWYKPVQKGMDHHNDAASLVVAAIAQLFPELLKTMDVI